MYKENIMLVSCGSAISIDFVTKKGIHKGGMLLSGAERYTKCFSDIHNLKNYELKFIHKKMREISKDLGFEYLDLLDKFIATENETIWNKYNDPHPNARGHEIIANKIFEIF